jgi:glutamate-1-semialdehyde aminotransferase
LIFDEITSGFRFNLGGYHLQCYKETESFYNSVFEGHQCYKIKEYIIPDICIFGKTISNGVSFSCIIGKKEIMENSEKAFISSTYFTEGLGFASAIETINQLKKQDYLYLWNLGKAVQNIWKKYSEKYKIEIEINEVPQLSYFKFKKNHQEYLTIFVNEMKNQGFIANNLFTPCFKHLPKYLLQYEKACEKVFKIIHQKEFNFNNYCELNNWEIIKEFPIEIKRG